MGNGISSLARQPAKLHEGNLRSAAVYGLAVHTTGSGIVDQARKLHKDPFEHAVAYYLGAEFYPHYVIGWDGTIAQIADESVRAQHIGFAERAMYLSDTWERKLPLELVMMWRAAWPGFKSPAELFPGASPNNVLVGVELLPLEDKPTFEPAFPGAKYTFTQHQALVMLGADLADRRSFPHDWARGSRLLGHEDINPLTRSTVKPPAGWDPGALRVKPWLNMKWVRGMLSGDSLDPVTAGV